MSKQEARNKKDFLFNVEYLEYLEILKKQKGFILIFCLSAMLTSLALTYVYPEKFEAGTAIYYRPVESSTLRPKRTESFGAPVPAPPFKIISQTLKDIVKNDAILRPVVKALRLDEEKEEYYPIWYERWYNAGKDLMFECYVKLKMFLKYGRILKEDPTNKAIEELRENVDIVVSQDSYVYVLKVRDIHPKRTAMIVDRVGQELVAWMKLQHKDQAEQRSLYLKKQVANKKMIIRKLRKQREVLLNNYNIVSVNDEMSRGTQSLYDIGLEQAQLKANIDEKKNIIVKLENELQKAGHVNPDDFKKMESEKLFTEIELTGLIAKTDSLGSSIDDLKKRLQDLPVLEKEVDDLDMRIASVARDHGQLSDLYLEALAESTSSQSEIKVLHPAVVPNAPAMPIKGYHVGLSAFLSLCLSVGLVYVFAFFNIRIFFASKRYK